MSVSSKKGNQLIEIIFLIFKKRYFLGGLVILFVILGFSYARLRQDVYIAKAGFVQQLNSDGGSSQGFGGLARLTGIDLGNAKGDYDVSPQLYSEIIQSIPFQERLAASILNLNKKDTISVQNYFLNFHRPSKLNAIKKYTIGLPKTVINAFKSKKSVNAKNQDDYSPIQKYSGEQLKVFSFINSSLDLTIEDKTGLTEVTFSLDNPVVAAQILLNSLEVLKDIAYELKYNQALKTLNYTEELYNEKKIEIDSLQLAIAELKDRNQSLSTNKANILLESTQNEFNIVYSTFLDLAKQIESAKLGVKESSASYIVLHPVTIPRGTSMISTFSVTLIFLLMGLVIGLFYLALRYYFLDLRNMYLEVYEN